MPNTKITDLTSLAAASGDEIPVNRSGSDGKITVGGIVNLVKLSANTTYYVRADGSDSNTGLADTAGGAFLTIHKAFQTIEGIDRGEFTITVEVGAGTFEGSQLRNPKGSGRITINGAGAASTTISPDLTNNTGDSFLFDDCTNVRFTGGFTFAASSGGFKTYIEADRSQIQFNATITLAGDATDTCFSAISSTITIFGGAFTIGSSGLGQFILVSDGSIFTWTTATLTFTSTPNIDAFGDGAIEVESNSFASLSFGSITGSSTGKKYSITTNSHLTMANKTIATWPLGSTSGTTDRSSTVKDTSVHIGGVPGAIGITIDGGGSAISTGVKGYISVPYAGYITDATVICGTTGSITIDVWKTSYAGALPTSANTIAGSTPLVITSTNKVQHTTTGWSPTTFSEGDVFAFKVDSVSSISLATVTIRTLR